MNKSQAIIRLNTVDTHVKSAKMASTSYSEQKLINAVEELSSFLRAALT